MPTRNLSVKDLQAVYDELAPKVVANFNAAGKLPPALLLVSMAEAEGVIADIDEVPTELIQQMQRTDWTKDAMMSFVAAILEEGSPVRNALIAAGFARPDLVVHITEAWALIGPNIDYDPSRAVSEHTAKQETILVNMHTSFGTKMQMMLVDPKTRQVQLAPFEQPERGECVMEGRMQVASWLGGDGKAAAH
jgi:hypothetical protein